MAEGAVRGRYAGLAEGWDSTAAARAASPRDVASTVRPSRGAAKVELSGKTPGGAPPARTSTFGCWAQTAAGHGRTPTRRSVGDASASPATRTTCRGPLREAAVRHVRKHRMRRWHEADTPRARTVSRFGGPPVLQPPRYTCLRVGVTVRAHADETAPPVLRERCEPLGVRRRQPLGEASAVRRSRTRKPRRASGTSTPATVGGATDSPADESLEVAAPGRVENDRGAGKCGDARPAAGGGKGSGGRSTGGKALERRAGTRGAGRQQPGEPHGR